MNDSRPTPIYKIGAKLIAQLAFTEDWNADFTQALCDTLTNNGVNIEDKDAVRALCTQHGINTADYGDTAPRIQFSRRSAATHEPDVRRHINAWHEAKQHQDARGDEDAVTAAEDLIESLLNYAGITITQ